MYLAGLDDPSLPDDPDAEIVFQAYPAYDMLEGGFTTYNQVLFYMRPTSDHFEFVRVCLEVGGDILVGLGVRSSLAPAQTLEYVVLSAMPSDGCRSVHQEQGVRCIWYAITHTLLRVR